MARDLEEWTIHIFDVNNPSEPLAESYHHASVDSIGEYLKAALTLFENVQLRIVIEEIK